MNTTQTGAVPEQETARQAPAFQAPKKKRKWPKVLIALLIAVALVFYFFIRPMLSAGQQLLAAAYLTEQAQLRDITVRVSSTGTVTPIDSARVTAKAMGEILEAPFEEGDQVEKDQLLYVLDAKDAEDAIRRAQQGADQAGLTLAQAERNVAQAERSVDQAQRSLDQAQRSYDQTLENLTVTATAAGTVQRLYVKAGDTVNTGSPIADIWDTDTMTIQIPFHSADAAALRVGQSGILTIEGTLEPLAGTITNISGASEVGPGGTLLRQVEFTVNNPGALTTTSTATAVVGGAACAGSGTFQYSVQRTVSAKTSGDITGLHFSAGDRIRSGDVLCTIGGTAAENTIENARNTLENAKSSLENAKSSLENSIGSLENSRVALENAQRSLEDAYEALDNYRITAPIPGTVVTKSFDAGDELDSSALSAAGGSLALLYDMSALTFQMQIDELDINKIQVGQTVTITADAVEGVTFAGVVDKLSINGTTISGKTNYPITVNIDDPGDLKPGMNVSADVIVGRVEQAITVPVEAVNRGAERPYVLVAGAAALDENGNVADPSRLERREVTLGRNDDSFIEIVDGLSLGEIVVWENQVTNPFVAMMQAGMR